MGVLGCESGECVGVRGWGCLWAVDGLDEAVADERGGEEGGDGAAEWVGRGGGAVVEESALRRSEGWRMGSVCWCGFEGLGWSTERLRKMAGVGVR